MKITFIFVILACGIALGVTPLFAQDHFPNYEGSSQAVVGTPGTQGSAASAYWNPAAWAAMRRGELDFLWKDHMNNWGLFAGGGGFGFSIRREKQSFGILNPLSNRIDTANFHVNDYQLAFGGGDPDLYWGVAAGWQSGDRATFGRDRYLSAGVLSRPWKYLSIGGAGNIGLSSGDLLGIADIGVRPLGTHRLTVFADGALGKKDNAKSMLWGAGIEVQPIDGLNLAFKLMKPDALDTKDNRIYSVGVGIALDGLGFHVAPHYDKDSKLMSTSYLFRAGSQQPSFSPDRVFKKKSKYVAMSMKGEMTYQKARWLDSGKIPLYETIKMLDAAKNDPTIGGIALNLSGFDGSHELVWELREKLIDFKSTGKKVYIYFDRTDMWDYYLATVADYLWVDPVGGVGLPGFVAGRTFYKGFFDKIGIGTEEWRYFDYKSAFEAYSRKDMSAKDKEQRLALITDFYNQWLKDIAKARGLSEDAIRADVDSTVLFTPQAALSAGLVDTIGRWEQAAKFIEKQTGKKPEFIGKDEVKKAYFADQSWGKKPEIAVVYAIGDCDMDTGIRGRYTSKLLRRLANDKNVKAVVLRADSPGGDALPSDLVSSQMDSVSAKKPMIVSQGNVAGSGGYWISMNGDRIFTSPFTITGSIGVIGGFFWNQGFSDKTGLTYDHVQVGEHAGLGAGVTVPLLGVMIPDRPLTAPEHAFVEKMIRGFYKDFTEKVAAGRHLEQAYVDSVGQGHIYSGERAIGLKLVDQIGGLEQSINYAKQQAKIKPSREVDVVEYPKPGLFNFNSMFAPSSPIGMLLGVQSGLDLSELNKDYELSVMRRVSQHPLAPCYMVPPEDMPADIK